MTALLTGLSALQTHQRAMQVTSHNIANAATPGYSRQRAMLSTVTPESRREGELGRGVEITNITRIHDSLLVDRLRQSYTETGRLEELSKILEDVELTFNEPSETALAQGMNRLFATFQDLSNNPESSALRSGTIQEMQTFASLMNNLADQMAGQRQDLGFGMDQKLSDLNLMTRELADLNVAIRRAKASGNEPNDLLDRQDELLRQISAEADVRPNRLADGTVLVELGGRLVVRSNDSVDLDTRVNGDGTVAIVYGDNLTNASITSGAIGALNEVANQLLPEIQKRVDTLALTLMSQMNTIHVTGTSATNQANAFLGSILVPTDGLTTNLDDPSLQPTNEDRNDASGIPALLQPRFVDETGSPVATNMTINVVNNETGVAEKYTVRYEPGATSPAASRSLQDLVNVINTGRGGGFTLYPPDALGVQNLTAQAIATSDGFRLSLVTDVGYSMDFSRSLDVQPAATAWTSADVSNLDGADAALADTRVQFRVESGNLVAYTVNPISRVENPYGQAAIAAGAATIGGFTFNFNGGAGAYAEGDAFSVDLDSNGAIVGGPLNIESTWTSGSASVEIKGRYRGDRTLIPGQPWQMEVVQGGIVGADSDVLAPNGPPLVKFTYNAGNGTATVQETVLVTLDQNNAPGNPVEIAEGVYAVFGEGFLTANQAGDINRLDFNVDGQPDQAGILTSLGIASIYTGLDASSMRLSEQLRESPGNLLVSNTRSAGDNENILSLARVREQRIYDNNTTTADEFYQATVSDVAVRVNQNEQVLTNQSALQASLQNRRDEISGVNIDEEVGLLILQQQAYQAAARIIQFIRENNELLNQLLA
jgi:flagellar hook-associated protein FlgK